MVAISSSLRRPSGEPPKVTVRVKACCLTSTSGRTLQAFTMLPTRPIRAINWSYSSLSAPVASSSEMVRIQVTDVPLRPSRSRLKWMLERSQPVQGDGVVVQDLALDVGADVGAF